MKEKIKKNLIIGVIVLLVIIGLSIYFLSSKNSGTEELKWKTVNTGLTTLQINTISENPTNQNILYAGANPGIFKSIDGGESWFAINNGLSSPLPNIKKIIYSPGLSEFDKESLFALSDIGELFETLDGGNNWLLRGEMVKDIAIKPNFPGVSSGEKIYILIDTPFSYTISKHRLPLLFSIDTGINFFSDPKLESSKEISSFYQYGFSNQTENIKVKEINFLKTKEDILKEQPVGFLTLGEQPVSILTQNSWFIWLLTDYSIYFCGENAENCEEQKVLLSGQEQKISKAHPYSPTEYFGYSQSGIPHIYLGNFLVKPCLYQGSTWIVNESLSKLDYYPRYTYVYAHDDYVGNVGGDIAVCYYKDEEGKFWGAQDIIFTLSQGKQYWALLVSMDNGKNWKVFRNIPSGNINSIFVKYSENNGYSIFLTTKDEGVIKTDIPFKSLEK